MFNCGNCGELRSCAHARMLHIRPCERGTGTPHSKLFHGTPVKSSSIGVRPSEQVVRPLATTEILASGHRSRPRSAKERPLVGRRCKSKQRTDDWRLPAKQNPLGRQQCLPRGFSFLARSLGPARRSSPTRTRENTSSPNRDTLRARVRRDRDERRRRTIRPQADEVVRRDADDRVMPSESPTLT